MRRFLSLHATVFRLGMLVALLMQAALPGAPQTASQPAAGRYRIAGRVVNTVTGEPVRRATVAALAEDSSQIVRSVQSDADGRFLLESLPAGKYPLTASKRGFITAFYDDHDDFNSAIVTGEDQDTGDLVFRLSPGAVLHGVVTADGGDPVENAGVSLYKRQAASADGATSGQVTPFETTTSDDTGAYEFSNLPAGEYLLAVVSSPWYAMHPPRTRAGVGNEEASPLDVVYPVTYYDSTTDEESASPIALGPGAREEADLSLHAVPALRLQVPVIQKENGIARPELRQTVFGVQVSNESAGFLDALQTGFIEFTGIAPGHYELMHGDPPRIVELDATSSQAIDATAGTPAVTITGTLRTTSGAAPPENVILTLEPVGGPGRSIMQTNARKGQFQFDAVAPGTWSLSALNQGNALQVVTVSTGGAAIAGNQITVKDRPLTLFARVSESLLRIKGFARTEGKGEAGAMIVLVPRQPSAYAALVRRDQSDSDGSFTLRDVPAGQYTVIAIRDGWKLDWARRDTMARYLPSGVAVTVPDRGEGVVSLPVPVPVQAR
jgi:5-hydroxyisourate hydrolase-like protein (transthyretin family)